MFQERSAAFDLLDALSLSGEITVDCAELHIVVAATHRRGLPAVSDHQHDWLPAIHCPLCRSDLCFRQCERMRLREVIDGARMCVKGPR